MQTVSSEFVKGKKVLLRYDIDVALGKGTGDRLQVIEDFKLKTGLDILRLCLANATKTVIIGHLGRPVKGGNNLELSAKPIQAWLEQALGQPIAFAQNLEQAAQESGKTVLLENIRFFEGETEEDISFAHKLATLGERYVNEAFSSYNKGVSTTILPTIMPHAAGLRFAEEVRILKGVRDNPRRPFVAIMGGAKVGDKLPVINELSKKADAVLVGGKLVREISNIKYQISNVLVGRLNEEGTDISLKTIEAWRGLIMRAKMIIWNGPLGKFEEVKNDATKKVAEIILDSGAQIVIGGGDTIAALSQYGLLEEAQQKAFVSVGGGAMLKFLSDGTLPTIEALS